MPGMTERVAQSPPLETPEQKRVRELSVKPVLTNPEIQEALQLLLKDQAADISRTRKPRP